MSPGVISQMNPGPYRPLCAGGLRVEPPGETFPHLVTFFRILISCEKKAAFERFIAICARCSLAVADHCVKD